MARYRGPRVKIVRRLGELPGLTTKVPNRNYGPGQHGQTAATKKLTQFRVRLQEKQKLRYNYGVTEKQLLIIRTTCTTCKRTNWRSTSSNA